ncbi:GntR family transcriptional regulator [Falsigemmobacter faecalis]|uniref:GntR family transcriptional regulator n=1 Tax=Falsigemmobacter faecalis TaxID=2488730 RepID=A0A3P3DPQ7_9RHOB|nr:GntR family transcriptional regulator [Falsigemmobacter faecalis]RRH76141.1 GntR family transcriptional regulator [Falsigemmobacter faecalis]
MPSLPPDSGAVLSDTVYERLRQGLMRAELHPHQRLKIRDLAREMGTSETPVREALLQLSRDGAVEIRPRCYVRIRRQSFRDYAQIRRLRLLLEPQAAEEALPFITAADLQHLSALHARLIAAEAAADWPAALQANADFHFTLYRRSANPHLIGVIETLWIRIGPMLSELYPHASPRYPGRHQHELILESLGAGNLPELRRAIALDLTEGGARLRERLQAVENSPV